MFPAAILLGVLLGAGGALASSMPSVLQELPAAQSEGKAFVEADIIGEAYSADGLHLLYREYHFFRSANTALHHVVYQKPQGQVIAEKWLDYQTGLVTPSFKQTDTQTGESIAVEVGRGEIIVRQQRGEPEVINQAQLTPKNRLVIDAGFDHFVRQHWDDLVNGQRLSFEFPSVHEQTLFQLRIRQDVCDRSLQEQAARCFLIEPDNWLARLFVDGIELAYQQSSRRLIRYSGMANVLSGDAENRVQIEYRYPVSTREATALHSFNHLY